MYSKPGTEQRPLVWSSAGNSRKINDLSREKFQRLEDNISELWKGHDRVKKELERNKRTIHTIRAVSIENFPVLAQICILNIKFLGISVFFQILDTIRT